MTPPKTPEATTTTQNNVHDVTENSLKAVRAWNELLTASTDMAFDVVLKNWDYSRSLRGSAEQAIEDALKTQHRLTSEMMQVWRGYTAKVEEIVKKTK
ncbi:MAG: hypothetical protein MI924_20350 [Chloroflexales bacterium]|nr:hypothetical protein [Chloroflexales bacterium]